MTTSRSRAHVFWRQAADFLAARRRFVLLLALAISVASAMLASRLPLQADFSNLLPPSADSVRQLRLIEKRTAVPSTFMIGLESADPDARARAAVLLRTKLDSLTKDLATIEYDEHVTRTYGWDHRFLFASLQDLEDARDALEDEIQKKNPLYVSLTDDPPRTAASGAPEETSIDKLRIRLREEKKKAEAPSERISPDGHLQLILLRASFYSEDSAASDRLLARLNTAIAETHAAIGPSVTIGMTGDAITSLAETHALLNGMVLSVLLTVVFVVGVLLLFYRTFLGVGALVTALGVGTVTTFGFTKLAIGHLNIASAFLSSIVIGNGINFGILLLARYLEERRKGLVGNEAIAAAMEGSAPGTIAAAMAAAAAYGSLVSTPFRGFRHFGIIGGVGMLLCWVSTYTVLPALLSIIDRRVHIGKVTRLGALLGHLVPKNPWPLAGLGLVLLAAVGGVTFHYLTHDPLENNLRNLRSSTHELDVADAWMDKFDKAFGNGISGGFVIAVDRPEEAAPLAERLRKVDEGKPIRERLFSHIATIDDLLPSDQEKKLAVLAEIRRMMDRTLLPRADDKEKADLLEVRPPNDLKAVSEGDIPHEIAWPFIERDGTRGRLVLANNGLGVDSWSVSSLDHFARTVRDMHLGSDVLVGGSAFVFSDMLEAMQTDGPRATMFSALGALAIVVVTVGFSRYALVTMLCGMLGTLGLLTAASLIGLRVNFLDFVALPITIGIGIDYSVNIASRAREVGATGRTAVETTGAAVLLCSYTTIVGYASLLFSPNKGIRTFGLSAMLGELTCITTALVFAPAFVDAFTRLRSRARAAK